MNRHRIKKVLDNKFADFVDSITDPTVRDLVKENTIITGGAIASLLLNEEVKDFDLYFRNKETVEAVAKYYVDKFNEAHPEKTIPAIIKIEGDRVRVYIKSAGITSESSDSDYAYFEQYPDEYGMDYVEKTVSDADDTSAEHIDEVAGGKYHPIFMSSNAITLSNKVQIVLRFYGEPDKIHENYDFAHCCNYWTSWDSKVVFTPKALESLLSKELQYQGSLYPLCSVFRTRKFLRRGWTINAGQYLKMCFQISELDLTNLDVLEEQLTGVDTAYFFQVLEYCKGRMAEDSEFKVTVPYLVSIIDKIFG